MDVRTLCLGVLMRGEATGYEIKKDLESGVFSHFSQASYGSIYPALAKLTQEQLITCREVGQQSRPDKKVYSITSAGEAALVSAISRPPAPDRFQSDQLFMLFFADYLSPEYVSAMIHRYRAGLTNELAILEERALANDPSETTGRKFVRGFGLSLYRAAIEYLEDNADEFTEKLPCDRKQVAE